MILDTGICTINRKKNTAAAGFLPVFEDVLIYRGWYGELEFATAPAWPTDGREEIQTDARIRILQNRQVGNHDRVILEPADGSSAPVYEVTRAYHGTDDESGEPITDLTLAVTQSLWEGDDE